MNDTTLTVIDVDGMKASISIGVSALMKSQITDIVETELAGWELALVGLESSEIRRGELYLVFALEWDSSLLNAKNTCKCIDGTSGSIAAEQNDIIIRTMVLDSVNAQTTMQYRITNDFTSFLTETRHLNASEGRGGVRIGVDGQDFLVHILFDEF